MEGEAAISGNLTPVSDRALPSLTVSWSPMWLPRLVTVIMGGKARWFTKGQLGLYGEWAMGATAAAPLQRVESVSDLRLPPRANQRWQRLMGRNTEGVLTDAERAELEALVGLSETLALVRATALQLLGRTPQ
jgi:hypothetical protein